MQETSRPSDRPLPRENDACRAYENLQIQQKRAVPDVKQILPDMLVHRLLTPVDLPPPCHPRQHLQSLSLPILVSVNEKGLLWSRTDQAHLALDYVDKLR